MRNQIVFVVLLFHITDLVCLLLGIGASVSSSLALLLELHVFHDILLANHTHDIMKVHLSSLVGYKVIKDRGLQIYS